MNCTMHVGYDCQELFLLLYLRAAFVALLFLTLPSTFVCVLPFVFYLMGVIFEKRSRLGGW